jgi:hypothetical protein
VSRHRQATSACPFRANKRHRRDVSDKIACYLYTRFGEG